MHEDLTSRVKQIVHDYMEAWKSSSELTELDAAEREELFGVIQDELGVVFDRHDLEELVDKEDLEIKDIVDAVEEGEELDEEY
ncbi:MAG: hypothetical protein M1379_14185 [Firmicutes bacterium]|nr:hypothetical protein [Bacillota bacterium]